MKYYAQNTHYNYYNTKNIDCKLNFTKKGKFVELNNHSFCEWQKKWLIYTIMLLQILLKLSEERFLQELCKTYKKA